MNYVKGPKRKFLNTAKYLKSQNIDFNFVEVLSEQRASAYVEKEIIPKEKYELIQQYCRSNDVAFSPMKSLFLKKHLEYLQSDTYQKRKREVVQSAHKLIKKCNVDKEYLPMAADF